MSIISKIKPSQYNIYVDYHDLPVKVLFDKDGKLYTKNIQFKVISFYIFGSEDVPEGLSCKIMKFSEFYDLVVQNGYKYISHYYHRKFFWHIDSYKAFTKEHLEHFFETTNIDIHMNSEYGFLCTDWIESVNGMKLTINFMTNTCQLLDFDDDVKNLIIPNTYMNYPVVEICCIERKFHNYSLESVFIPKSIKRISGNAFRYCVSLEKVCFDEDSELEDIRASSFSESSIKEIIIPKSVKHIGDDVFFDCPKLEKVVFAKDSSLTSLGRNVFAYCPLLKSLELPKSIETIRESFTDSGISSMTIPMIKKKFCNDLTFFGGFLHVGFYEERSILERIIISDGSIAITASAFNDCYFVKEIIIPNTILLIGEMAFPPAVYSDIKIIYKGTIEQWQKIEKHVLWMNTVRNRPEMKVEQIFCVDGIYKV